MKVNELRIGNLVKYKYDLADFVTVKGIDSEYVYLDIVTNDYVLHDDIEGIPLTEEILLKCDLEKIKEPNIGIRCAYRLRRKSIRITLSNSGHWYFKRRIIYLHDLQNIVLDLTGTELNTSKLT